MLICVLLHSQLLGQPQDNGVIVAETIQNRTQRIQEAEAELDALRNQFDFYPTPGGEPVKVENMNPVMTLRTHASVLLAK